MDRVNNACLPPTSYHKGFDRLPFGQGDLGQDTAVSALPLASLLSTFVQLVVVATSPKGEGCIHRKTLAAERPGTRANCLYNVGSRLCLWTKGFPKVFGNDRKKICFFSKSALIGLG